MSDQTGKSDLERAREVVTYFCVSFKFADDRPDANTQDFRDELMEYFEQAVLEGRMTDVTVKLDHWRQAGESE